jgi:hypothetical protein
VGQDNASTTKAKANQEANYVWHNAFARNGDGDEEANNF